MEYKPAPGEPYRPVLSPPRRLSSLLPEWSKSGCIIPAALFNGVDPPRALKPAEILTPRVTRVQPTASVTAVAAPASGVRANEPSKTPNPSTPDDKKVSTPSDPGTSESGSEVGDPSSPGLKQVDPKITDPNAVDSEDFDIHKSNSNNADLQVMKPSAPEPETTPVDASKPDSPKPENLDPKQAKAPPSDSQEINPQVVDGHDEPQGAQSSTPQVSNPDDPKAATSSPDRSQQNVPDTSSNDADSSNEYPENYQPNAYTPTVFDATGIDVSSSNAQGEEVADPDTNIPDSFMGQSKQLNSHGQDSAMSRPNKSPAAESEANDGDVSMVKGPDLELDPFDVMPTNSSNIDDALSPTAKSDDGQYSTPNGSEHDPSSQPEDLEYPPSGGNQNDDDVIAKPAFADDHSLSHQQSANVLPSTYSDAIVVSLSRTAPTDDSASADVAIGTSKEVGSASSSASLAASGIRLGNDGTSTSRSPGMNANAAASGVAKDSGSDSRASRRHPSMKITIIAGELLLLYIFLVYWGCSN